MAFGAQELRVLRRALALALHPTSASAEDVQDCLRLAESLDEATRESVRLRAFLVADLGRYRAALPGTVVGYLRLLEEALGAGYRPDADDLAALRALRGNPAAAALLDRCRLLAEEDVRARLAGRTVRVGSVGSVGSAGSLSGGPSTGPLPKGPLSVVPASRTRLLALPGGQAAEDPEGEPERKPSAPRPEPARDPAAPAPGRPKPGRPVPTPGEVFPRRKPAPPPQGRRLAAG
ncbi:hypothetical protein [Streptomyces sp. NEAU-W12]|uniref:hypothetical protein n=1 Tax=Streptomyces sp. NEAU-W12 TaxID=2994668 RepID=UPI00224AA4A8|nr:hypothetical protein [Streptomyces sp. NEAU-W12]MCX2927837.1 hypothetical protein [Streptomyces sp. NEAU-W12]